MESSVFFKKFDSLYSKHYEYDWDDDMEQLFISYCIDRSCHLEGLFIDIYEDSFSIYRDFLYEDHYGPFSVIETCKDEILFSESIKRVTGQSPECVCDDGLGCPFFSNQIGFFRIPFSWDELNQKIETMVDAYCMFQKLSFSEIDLAPEDQFRFDACKQDLLKKLKGVSPFLCNKHITDAPEYHKPKYESLHAYTSRFNVALIGIGLDDLQTVCTLQENSFSFYSGFRYFIVSINGQNYSYDKQLVKSIIEAFREVDEECDVDGFLHYFIDSRFRLVLTCGEMWAVVCFFESGDCEKQLTIEKNKLKKLHQEFVNVAPEFFWNRSFDFATLDDGQFEALCRDLLLAKDFVNIRVHGKTRAPDGGIDITAEENFETESGIQKRIWLFQCKHTKKQINRKDLSEVRYLLKEFQADCYGLFYSGFFTTSTLKRIQTIRDEDQVEIQGWDHNSLELELAKKPNLATKYFGV